ncbi:hypothetical protein MTsDn1_25740 [Alteromonas sp. MTD1]
MLRQELPQISFRILVSQFSSLNYFGDNSFHIFQNTHQENIPESNTAAIVPSMALMLLMLRP